MANIQGFIDQIKTAIYGREVRGSLADGLDAVNKETEATSKKQSDLDATFGQLIINAGDSNAEIVASRHDSVTGETYDALPKRLDATSAQLATKVSQINYDADRAYFESRVDALTSPWGESFATFAILQSTLPTNDGKLHAVDEDDSWYFWLEGYGWTAGGKLNTAILRDESVDVPKLNKGLQSIVRSTSQGQPGKNLFNKTTAIYGFFVDYLTGELVANSSLAASDFIEVNPNTVYTKNNTTQLAFYDSNFTYISGLNDVSTFTTPINTKYVRLSVRLIDTTEGAGIDSLQLEQGNKSSIYEEFKIYLPKDNIPPKTIEDSQLDFIPIKGITGKNLFNKNNVRIGYFVDFETGHLIVNAAVAASDYIEIKPSTTYAKNNTTQFAFYDEDKNYISGLNDVRIFTTPSNAKYVRLSVRLVDTAEGAGLDSLQLEEGNENTSYEPYKIMVPVENLPANLNNPNIPYNLEIQLPDDIYLVTDESFSVYYNNIIKYSQQFRKGNYYFAHINKSGNEAKGNGYPYKWEYTPTVEETFQIEFAVFETYTKKKVANKTVTFHVANSKIESNHNRTATVVTIGDSFADIYGTTSRLYDFITQNGGGNNINMIGTRPTEYENVKDDAISGWSYATFNTVESQSQANKYNAFFNPTTKKFDFSYYMAQHFPSYSPSGQEGNHIDAFISLLGLNDSIWDGFNLNISRQYVQNIIDSVKAYDSNIKILLSTVTPQPLDDKFLTGYGNYSTGGNYEKSKYNQELWNEMMLEFHHPTNGIWVIPTAAHFDTRSAIISSNFNPDKFNPSYSEVQTSDIHPTEIGAKYIADAMYQAIYNLVLR